jgi:hypothetical protein
VSTDSLTRFLAILTESCSITRAAHSAGTNKDLELGTPAVIVAAVDCTFAPMTASKDMLTVGPMERQLSRLFLPAGTNIQQHDVVTDALGIKWIVSDPPIVQMFRGEAHHVEALLIRKAVQ